jgi:hypothetical protein
LTLDGEVLDSEVIFPIVAKTFVEGAVLLRSDVRGIACPNRLRLVELLVRNLLLLDLLSFLLLLVFVFFDFLDLGLVIFVLLGLFFSSSSTSFSTSLVTVSWIG